jgi:protein-tyrosine phosphatase
MGREQGWEGAVNARDLGGLAAGTARTQYGRVFRSAKPEYLTDRGWAQLLEAGITTVIDLRNGYERHELRAIDALTVHHHPVEDQIDASFMAEWGNRLDTPDYYPEVLLRWPELVTSVFARIADAPSGGVLVHCRAGRDRTGMISAMLLSLVGTSVQDILDDYELAVRAMNAYLTAQSEPAEEPHPHATLDAFCTSSRASLAKFLESTDVPTYLTTNGLSPEQLDRIRDRLLLPA